MRRVLRGFLVVVLSVLVGGMAAAITPWQDCPKCHYSFPGPVPPPTVGGVATGTGFVVHSDGYVLTNHHVIEGSSAIKVMIGGREYTATVVESLPTQDLALLKIEARGLTAVSLGNSDLLQVGDDVFAIGCPGGICGTVTAGRVANIGVTITVEEGKRLQGMLMVDITTDHGSSGGPLTNSRGEVVGITTAGKQGAFGFSIPINQAIPLLRRVPGFSVQQMGQATTELSFKAIRDRMTPVTAFIQTDQGTALQLPPRYDTSKWPRASGGMVCRTSFDPFVMPRCHLDQYVPPGWRLLGFEMGFADSQSWTRSFPSITGEPVSFSQETTAWIMQFDTRLSAEAVARAYCCPGNLGGLGMGGTGWWAFGGCTECLKERALLASSSTTSGPVTVRREVTVYLDSSPDRAVLIYSVIATLDTYLVALVVSAGLSQEGRFEFAVWAWDDGLLVQYRPLLGTWSPAYVVMAYSAFIEWATAREKELLEFILKQF